MLVFRLVGMGMGMGKGMGTWLSSQKFAPFHSTLALPPLPEAVACTAASLSLEEVGEEENSNKRQARVGKRKAKFDEK